MQPVSFHDQEPGLPAEWRHLLAAVNDSRGAATSPARLGGPSLRSTPPTPARWRDRFRGWFRPAPAPYSPARAASAPGLKQLVYRSHGTGLMSLEALESLLIATRMKNRAAGITGLLIHYRSQYLQCLEGPAAAVDALFLLIGADVRHDRVVVLHEGTIDQRSFAGWNMACARVSDSAWLQMSTAAWQGQSQLPGRAAASPGFTLMQNAWRAATDNAWGEALPLSVEAP